MSPRLVLFGAVALSVGCVPPASPSSPASPGGRERDAPVPTRTCSAALLARFDPDLPVVERGPLPPMEQATEAQVEHLATLACDEAEDDDACVERARRVAGETYPQATATTVAIGVDREILRVALTVDGAQEVARVESLAALGELVAARRARGATVVVDAVERLPAPDAQRSAVIRVSLPSKHRAREALRAYLILEPPRNAVGAMMRLRRRAAMERVELRAIEPQDGGRLRVEIGCERAVPSAEVLPSEAQPPASDSPEPPAASEGAPDAPFPGAGHRDGGSGSSS